MQLKSYDEMTPDQKMAYEMGRQAALDGPTCCKGQEDDCRLHQIAAMTCRELMDALVNAEEELSMYLAEWQARKERG